MFEDDQGGSLLGGAKSDLGYDTGGDAYGIPSGLALGGATGDGLAVPGAGDGLGAGAGPGAAAAPASVAIGEEAQKGAMPRILLLGLKRSGKSSILKVVFNKMSPHETRHLESTKTPEKCSLRFPTQAHTDVGSFLKGRFMFWLFFVCLCWCE